MNSLNLKAKRTRSLWRAFGRLRASAWSRFFGVCVGWLWLAGGTWTTTAEDATRAAIPMLPLRPVAEAAEARTPGAIFAPPSGFAVGATPRESPNQAVLVGRVVEQRLGEGFVLDDGTHRVRVFTARLEPYSIGANLEVRGQWRTAASGPPGVDLSAAYRRVPGTRNSTRRDPALADTTLPLTNVAQVLALSPMDALEGRAAQLRGTAIQCDPPARAFFLEDDTGALMVLGEAVRPDLVAGQRVEIRGRSGWGGAGAVVRAEEIVPGVVGPIPPSRPVTLEYLLGGFEDCRRVRVAGVVRHVSPLRPGLAIDLLSEAGMTVQVDVMGSAGTVPPEPGQGAFLELEGVCLSLPRLRRDMPRLVMWLGSTNDLRWTPPTTDDAWRTPVAEIERLDHRLARQPGTGLRRVMGTVTWSVPGEGFYLQDESGAIQVHPRAPAVPKVGAGVEVLGYGVRTNRVLSLGDAQWRLTTNSLTVSNRPIDLSAQGVLEGREMDGRLVRLEGTLVDSLASPTAWLATVRSGDTVFRAMLHGGQTPSPIVPGSRCAFVGVCNLDSVDSGHAVSFLLLARGAEDIQLLAAAPWWRTDTATRLLPGMAVLLAVAGLWTVSLRRQVTRSTRQVRQRLEREAQLEARYRDLFENALDVIFVCDLETRILSLNQAAQVCFGRGPAVGGGLSLRELLAPESVPLWDQILKTAATGKPLSAVEFSLRGAEGRSVTLEATLRPLRPLGKTIGIECIARDVTERKRMEIQLRQLSRATEQSPVAIFLTDTKGYLEYVNPRFTRLTGYAQAEVLGQHTRMLRSGETAPAVYQQLWTTILAGDDWHGELSNRKKNGEAYRVMASISPILDGRGGITHFLAIQEDVTERRRLEERLQQAAKMESIGQLASGVAHDFNNLLTVILGHAEVLLEGQASSPETRESLRQIAETARRASGLTRQLLAFGRKQILRMRALDLNELLRNLAGMLRPMLGEKVDLRLTLQETLPAIRADSTMLEQVVMNLAVNGRDAMADGGVLRLGTVSQTLTSTAAAALGEVAEGLYVVLEVQDEGCGMDERMARRIFEPFFTTKALGKGTGLGLAMVYGIVKQHGGTVEVSSTPGRGSLFRVWFPASQGGVGAATPQEAGADPMRGGESILVVEDEPPLRALVRNILRRQGYEVTVAESAVEALALWRRRPGAFALLLTDMVMPGGVSGRELAARLCGEQPSLKVIYTSGYSVELAGRDFALRPTDRFLAKPYPPKVLAKTVRECLDGVGGEAVTPLPGASAGTAEEQR